MCSILSKKSNAILLPKALHKSRGEGDLGVDGLLRNTAFQQIFPTIGCNFDSIGKAIMTMTAREAKMFIVNHL